VDVSTVPSLFATGVGEELNILALNLADDIPTRRDCGCRQVGSGVSCCPRETSGRVVEYVL
jgi:hypothetical protein